MGEQAWIHCRPWAGRTVQLHSGKFYKQFRTLAGLWSINKMQRRYINTWHHANQNSTKTTPHIVILLMEEILHQSMGSVSHYSGQVLYIPGGAGFLPSTIYGLSMQWTKTVSKSQSLDPTVSPWWPKWWAPGYGWSACLASGYRPPWSLWFTVHGGNIYQKWSSKRWHSKVA